MTDKPLWRPSRSASEEATSLASRPGDTRLEAGIQRYPAFYRWTTDSPREFWNRCGVRRRAIEREGVAVLVNAGRMPARAGIPTRSSTSPRTSQAARRVHGALVLGREQGEAPRQPSRAYEQVAGIARALRFWRRAG